MNSGTVGNYCEILSRLNKHRAVQWQGVVFLWNFFFKGAVKVFVFKKQDGIRVFKGTKQQALCLRRR